MDLEALVSTLGGRNDRCIADERVVDARIRDEVRLELVEVDIECTIETERRGNRADDLGNEAVEMLRAGPGHVQIAAADIVDGLVINKEGTVRIFDGAVSGENSVVRFDDRSGDAWSRVDGELKLALLAILSRQPLEEKSAKARTGAAAEGVEDEETLEGVAVV